MFVFCPRSSEEMSFYFSVSDVPLADLDPVKPHCEKKTLCKDRKVCPKKKKMSDCSDYVWHSELFVSDNLTGLRDLEVTSPGSRIVRTTGPSPWVIGSSRSYCILVETECCYDGVELSVWDVAGNLKKCVAGINPNCASQNFNSSLFIFGLFIFLVVMN